MMPSEIPHLRIVVAVSAFILLGFAGVTTYVLVYSDDLTTKGNLIGAWQNFAVLAIGFWLGSSSAGKAKDPTIPTGKPTDPLSVEDVTK